MKRELGIDSENSSLHLGDREEDDISVVGLTSAERLS